MRALRPIKRTGPAECLFYSGLDPLSVLKRTRPADCLVASGLDPLSVRNLDLLAHMALICVYAREAQALGSVGPPAAATILPLPRLPRAQRSAMPQDVMQQACRVWTTYCPAGDRCKMGGAHQEYRNSLDGAKSKMCRHLFLSPYHGGDYDPEQRFATWALCQTEAGMFDYDVKYLDNELGILDEVEYITKYGSLPEVFPEAGAGFDAEEQCDAEEQ